MRKAIAAAALACAAVAASSAASALPVIPGAAGFGIETPAGRGGKVYRVTNLNASGAGSLKACVDASGPRVCVFEVSGTIRANEDLIVRNPNITIAGQTAPSPGVMWRGGALWIATSDVLVQHMRFRAGDDPDGPDFGNRDALKIDNSSASISDIVVDHCTFSWAMDETVQVWKGWNDVTLSNNIISEGLHESFKPNEHSGHALIVGPNRGRIAIIGNLLANHPERHPFSRGSELVFVNNVIYNRATKGVDLMSQDGIETRNAVVGNVFVRGPDYGRNAPVNIRNDGAASLAQSKLYVSDNAAVEAVDDDAWSIVRASEGSLPSSFRSNLPPTWPAGLTRLATDRDVVLESVLRHAGARPADRDSVDKRVVQQVRDGTGRIINCVSPNGTSRCNKNAGGWPSMAENRRTLSLPADPNAVTPSGYTNLELWLHKMSAEVEGQPASLPAAPVLAGG